jgi:hypothetical protein
MATTSSADTSVAIPDRQMSLEELVDSLADRKDVFLDDAYEKVLRQVSNTSRTELVSIIEKDGNGIGEDRLHRPGPDSYVKVFSRFVAKKTYHDNKLDSAISEPVAITVSECYSTFIADRQVEIAEFFMKKIVEDEVLRTTILSYAADELLKRGIKKGRSHIVSVLTHALMAHAAHTHVGLAIQHGILVATSHVAGVVGGTTAAVGGALLATLILKAVATHMGLTMTELLHTQALHGLAAVLAKKAGLAACAGVAVSFLATHVGTAGAAAVAHVLVAPLAVGAVAAVLYRLPKSLGKKVASGVQKELSGEFSSMTSQVLDDLVKGILSAEALGKAIANEIVGMENWQDMFEGGVDTSAFPGLDSDMSTDVGDMNDIYQGIWGNENQSPSTNMPPHEAPCPICNMSMYGVNDTARHRHILGCTEPSSQIPCPICGDRMDGSTDSMRDEHILECVRKKSITDW